MADWTIEEAAPTGGRVANMIPPGTHRMRIKSASEGAHKWRSGEYLMLRLHDLAGQFDTVFDDIPCEQSGAWRAKSLAEAVGLAVGSESVSVSPDDLLGVEVLAEIVHSQSKATGKVYANVVRYHAAPPVNAATVETRPAKRGRMPASAADDIPF